ncbi:centromere-associated protein E-like [Salmo trutta]|uniref:centromere-associated protein E-like n=1 Tax=Salmo trutta TaxID=8032 RepID=UPI0011300256|nr:centromere-associated protein E-like [Salmo trutta]
MAEESAVKVCVHVRPLIEREETAAESAETVKLYWKADMQTIHQVDDGNFTNNFSFDRVFSAEETTLQLCQELAKPLVSTVEGYNGKGL